MCVVAVAWIYDDVVDLPLEVRKYWAMDRAILQAQGEDLTFSHPLKGSLRWVSQPEITSHSHCQAKRHTGHEPLILKGFGVHLGKAYGSGSGVNSPSAKNYSSQSAGCEVLHPCDAQNGWTLADGRDCHTREAGDSRRQMIEYKRENAPEIWGTIAHFATHTWPTRHGLQIRRADDDEIPFLRLEHVPHYHSMVAAQLIRGELALPQYYFPFGYPPFYENEGRHRNDAIQY